MGSLGMEQDPNRTLSIGERLRLFPEIAKIFRGIFFDWTAVDDYPRIPVVLKQIPRTLHTMASYALSTGQSVVGWVQTLPSESAPPAYPIDMPEPPDYKFSGARPRGTPPESEEPAAVSADHSMHPGRGRDTQL